MSTAIVTSNAHDASEVTSHATTPPATATSAIASLAQSGFDAYRNDRANTSEISTTAVPGRNRLQVAPSATWVANAVTASTVQMNQLARSGRVLPRTMSRMYGTTPAANRTPDTIPPTGGHQDIGRSRRSEGTTANTAREPIRGSVRVRVAGIVGHASMSP